MATSSSSPVLHACTTPSPDALRPKEEKSKLRTHLSVLAKLPSSDSLNLSNSPAPASPASPGLITNEKNMDFVSMEKLDPQSKLTRKESYKAQRKNYRREKKRVTNELLNSLKDPSVVVLADWLKVRGTLKSWTKLWCVLKPGMLLLYKSPKCKSAHWVGTILLNSCKVIERPSKKDGFCFKLYNPLDQSIWAPRGPENETIGAVIQPLPNSHTIFRAPSQASGMCWLDALEISLRNDAALVRSVSNKSHSESTNHETQWSEADYEKHFEHDDLDDGGHMDNGAHLSAGDCEASETESDVSAKEEEDTDEEPQETAYISNNEGEFGDAGAQVEELADEHKSLIWYLVKQVRPGMDLSKVVLPTFVLEPRSFLDKLTDSYYHVDILSNAVLEDDAFTRMKSVVRWYVSGFYKKPKGLKKPYNPILGETFRCFWLHPNGSKTFYIAEQVSHHPPVSAFYVTNRQEGFSITASILAKSKFYGNSTSAILDGIAILSLLPRGENYTLTVPYAHCKGILMGTLSMELGGKVTIECEKTGYSTDLEFKLRPFLGGSEQTNCISGRLKLGKETMATLEGYWDRMITIKDRRTGEQKIFWNPSPTIRKSRLKRFTVPLDQQEEHESERLWQHVSAAILRDDMNAATDEKTSLEEVQRMLSKERKAKCEDWIPNHFQQDFKTGQWVYKQSDLRPWDSRNDMYQYEFSYAIATRTKHPTPMIRTSSIVSVEPNTAEPRGPNKKRKVATKQASSDVDGVESPSESEEYHSDSTQSVPKSSQDNNSAFVAAIDNLERSLKSHHLKLDKLGDDLQQIMLQNQKQTLRGNAQISEQLMYFCAFLVVQTIFMYLLHFWK